MPVRPRPSRRQRKCQQHRSSIRGEAQLMPALRTIRRASGITAVPAWIVTIGIAVAIIASRRASVRLLGGAIISTGMASTATACYVMSRLVRTDADDLVWAIGLGAELGGGPLTGQQ